LNVLQVESF